MSLPLSRACGNPGETCGALMIGPAGYCQRHDPQQAAIRRHQASQAAKKSHEWKPDAEVTAWADTLDLTTRRRRAKALTETARLVALGGLSVGQGNAIAALARAAALKPGQVKKRETLTFIEERYALQNGQEPSS